MKGSADPEAPEGAEPSGNLWYRPELDPPIFGGGGIHAIGSPHP
jgi:hypothetical protein